MSRLRSQAGFTLPELIVAMAIGMATVLAVYAVLDTSIKQSNDIAGRVNATQRGRIAMDIITRQLRSQVCYCPTVPAIVSGTNDSVSSTSTSATARRRSSSASSSSTPTAGR